MTPARALAFAHCDASKAEKLPAGVGPRIHAQRREQIREPL
jgi:hypothetical protein